MNNYPNKGLSNANMMSQTQYDNQQQSGYPYGKKINTYKQG
jgi:hypothetical protein